MSRFSDTLMEHFQSPASRGAMECPDLLGRGSLGGYPPFVTVYLRVDGNRIAHASFEAEGCGVTIACGSILTELVRGRTFDECASITAQHIAYALDGIPVGKESCAEVTISALRDAIRTASHDHEINTEQEQTQAAARQSRNQKN
jgi:NifU-like protein involved in Fe-S cluster formation